MGLAVHMLTYVFAAPNGATAEGFMAPGPRSRQYGVDGESRMPSITYLVRSRGEKA